MCVVDSISINEMITCVLKKIVFCLERHGLANNEAAKTELKRRK